jgi:hypothetical protein
VPLPVNQFKSRKHQAPQARLSASLINTSSVSDLDLLCLLAFFPASSVTQAEAQNWEESREQREQRAAALRQQLLEQYRQRGQAPPEVLLKEP